MSQSEQECIKCGISKEQFKREPLLYAYCGNISIEGERQHNDHDFRTTDNKPMVDSRTIAHIAAKRKFDPVREAHLVEKARRTKCRCKHYTQTRPCFYHTCRHMPENHFGISNDNAKVNLSNLINQLPVDILRSIAALGRD